MTTSNLIEIIQKRRAVFPHAYNEESIPDQLLLQILEAGNWAPTHKKTEPWRYRIFRGQSLQKLSDFLYQDYVERTPKDQFSPRKANKKKNNPLKSAAVIAICMKRHEVVPEWEEIASVAMSVQNIWLVCSSLNIGAYWSSPNVIHRMDSFLELSADERCIGLFYMGHIDTLAPPSERTAIESKIKWM